MTTSDESVVVVAGLRMRYGARDVLDDVTFQVRRGEVLALLGPNGAGKTTTIEILEGFRARSAGVVTVLGLDPARATQQWRARVGIVLAISGVFYPITALPSWLQWVGQVFPMYWLGLGMRSALLPESAAIVEIGQSWRHPETVAVLGAWAVVGLIAAPLVLTRMARRESGSRLAERREQALQRIG
jgi:ABC-2 type transport system permease protein